MWVSFVKLQEHKSGKDLSDPSGRLHWSPAPGETVRMGFLIIYIKLYLILMFLIKQKNIYTFTNSDFFYLVILAIL